MTPRHQPKYTAPRPNRNPQVPTKANMRFGMPASWEECIELGIHPLTGEPLAAGEVVG